METMTVPQRPRKRMGPAATFFLVAGLLVLLVLALVIAYAGTIAYRGSARVNSELAKIRAAGEPMTSDELSQHYQLPPGVEDTTDLWLEATGVLASDEFGADAGKLPIVGNSQVSIPPTGEPWGELDSAEQLLEKYRRPLEQMHRAAERGGAARYPIDFSQGMFLTLEYVQKLRAGARALALQAHVRAHRGDAHGAAESIRTGLALARSMEREPVLVSMLVGIACNGVAQGQLEQLLHSVDFSDEDLLKLQEALRKGDHRESLRQGLIGERALGMMLAVNPSGSRDGSRGGVKGALWRVTQSEGTAYYLDYMTGLIDSAEKPWPQAIQEAKLAESRLMQLTQRSVITRSRYVIPALVAPAISAAVEASARSAATNGAADAAIACQRYRLKHGALPESLEQLVPEFLPEVPLDPYTGEPLGYVVREDEYLVYSVGSNGIDEGGLVTDRLDGDHVFRVGPPPEAEEVLELDPAAEPSDDGGQEPVQDPN